MPTSALYSPICESIIWHLVGMSASNQQSQHLQDVKICILQSKFSDQLEADMERQVLSANGQAWLGTKDLNLCSDTNQRSMKQPSIMLSTAHHWRKSLFHSFRTLWLLFFNCFQLQRVFLDHKNNVFYDKFPRWNWVEEIIVSLEINPSLTDVWLRRGNGLLTTDSPWTTFDWM